MFESAGTIRAVSLQRWLRLPAARVRCVRHFLGIAVTLAAAKVLLFTIGVAGFVAEQGAAGLPPFYVVFAAIAILLSFGLTSIIDRAPKVRLAQMTFAGLMLGTAALRFALALEIPGVSVALLASATAFEIILDIVFWVVVAAYLDGFEFKRATPLVYMALALGGAAGGAIARLGAAHLPPADLLLLLPPLAALLVVQFEAVAKGLGEIPESHPDTAAEPAADPGVVLLVRLLKRYPLALLIALNALVVTLLYGLSEFLIFSIYETRFLSETELAEFLSLLFALMQIVEFGLLYTLTRFLLERTGPLLRNLVFPLTSLGGLIFLVLSPRLLAAVVVHVNIEAASNALFLPIGNANYIALPLGFQGRARTLSEGIFYPIGLALAGALLWNAAPGTTPLQAQFAALISAGLFVLLSAGIGLLFLPTLRANVGSGLITPRQNIASEAAPAPRVTALLHSREPELRLLGLALAQRLDPRTIEDGLLVVATRPDRTTRAALARLIAGAPEGWAEEFLDRCLAGATEEERKLALFVMLIRRARPTSEQMSRVLSAHDPTVLVLAHVAAAGLGAWGAIQPLVRTGEVASDLVDAIVRTGRTDLAPLLLGCLATAEPEQQQLALVMLNGAEGLGGTGADVLPLLTKRRNSAVRAEAIVLLSRTGPRAGAARALVAALDDPDARVRRRAAEVLCQHGDRATVLLRPRLVAVTAASLDAVWALARIASPRARRLLAAYIYTLRQDAERTSRLLDWIAGSPDEARWSALELCLRDHQARMVDVALAALSAAIEGRLSRRVRVALHGPDQRSRASAFELIAAAPSARLIPGAIGLLRYLLFEHDARRPADSGPDRPEEVLREALASISPWVRRAGSRAPRPPASSLAVPPESVEGAADRDPNGDPTMGLDDQEFERIVALKRTPVFRHLPFETVTHVARSVQARTYLAGEEVIKGGSRSPDLLILEAGALSIAAPDGVRPLVAPVCFGEIALAGEPLLWPTIKAVEDARVSFLQAPIFEELCREHPEIAIELCRVLARRLREAGDAAAAAPTEPDIA